MKKEISKGNTTEFLWELARIYYRMTGIYRLGADQSVLTG